VSIELRVKRDALEHLWRQGLSGQELLHRHSQLIDDYLTETFSSCAEARKGMSLTALGGYGRKELFPFSDIDLLLLYDPEVEKNLPAVTETLFYPLWDAGFEVGHGVRTPEACLADAKNDFFFQVAMLDARPLAGSRELFDELQRNFRRDIIEGHRRNFLQKMIEHREERHRRFGLHGYQLEPHIKESRGGFRDIQSMLWVAQAVFGLYNLRDLEEAGLLTGQERTAFEQAVDHLIKIRNRLHYLSGRKNDQLYFEHQEEMARALKYWDKGGVLGVELFMRDLYHHFQTIANTVDLFFEHVDETLGLTVPVAAEQELEDGISVRHGRVQLIDPELLLKKPHLLMRIFFHAAHLNLGIHHRTRKLITMNLHLVDDRLRHSRRMAKSFLEILQHGENLLAVLTEMLDTGLLIAYLPEFAGVKSLAQHDVYHIYTVDRHLLQTVAELKNLGSNSGTPFAAISRPHILILAALLHDIGKGHHQDHSQRGAELAAEIVKRLGLPKAEADCLLFLIEKHLFLTLTALRRDLEDHAFILQCAREIKTPERLAMLYQLSLADAKATGPTAWNDWKAALLLELSLKIAHLLERKDLQMPDTGEGAVWMLEQLKKLLPDAAAANLEVLPEDYILSFQPKEIAHHLTLRRKLGKGRLAIVEPCDLEHYWSVLVMAQDCTGLLAKICGTLALHGYNVVSAQIFTWDDGTAVDVLNIQSSIPQEYSEQDWQSLEGDLNLALKNRLGLSHRLVDKFRSNFPGSSQKKMRSAPRVVIDNQASRLYTIIEVYANDRPGLLYDITRTLADFEINIHRAKISSDRDQIVDVFYTLDNFSTKINNPSFQEEISRALLYIAGNDSSSGIKI
jgi:[protein-PII] uridylyltransferase